MKSSNKMLVGFGIGIGIMLIAAVILVLTVGRSEAQLLPQNSPEGTVQRYLTAIQDKDFKQAYSYISPPVVPTNDGKIAPQPPNVPPPPNSYDMWLNSVQNALRNSWKATLEQATINGDSANVQISVEIFSPGAPFSNPIRNQSVTFMLQRIQGAWLITSPTDLYFIY